MAQITIAGDSLVITSSKTLEDIKALEKHSPKALCLFETDENGKKEEVFRVGTTKGPGSINRYGASFGGATHDDDKLATITLAIPADVKNGTDYAVEKIGTAILMLNEVEAQFDAAIAAHKAEQDAVRAAIVGVAVETLDQQA